MENTDVPLEKMESGRKLHDNGHGDVLFGGFHGGFAFCGRSVGLVYF